MVDNYQSHIISTLKQNCQNKLRECGKISNKIKLLLFIHHWICIIRDTLTLL